LDASAPGSFERTLTNQSAAGEEVGSSFGLLLRASILVTSIQQVGATVIDDVLELVKQGEPLSRGGVGR
jgi:hypothetical protein